MKFIENKKLFGKINIFDIAIIILVLIIGIVAVIYFKSSNKTSEKYISKEYTIRLERLPVNFTDNVKVGDKIYNNKDNIYLGEVVSVEKKDYTKVIKNTENNTFNEAKSENYENALITIKSDIKDEGADLVTSTGYVVKVGTQVFLRGPSYAGSGFIIKIER